MHESFGTDTKPFHVGAAAQAGLTSALLAKNGFGGSLEGLEAERGWSHVISTRENLTDEFSTFGKVWETTKNTFKPFPCDRIIHAAIDGWIQISEQAKEEGLDVTKIANVTARTAPRVLFLTDDPEPETGLAGKFSVYHAAAVALLYGEATPSQFTDEAVQNKTVIALREKVHVTSDDNVSEHEAFVAVEFENGKKLEVHVEHCIGSYENPLDAKFLQKKFVNHVRTQIGEERAKKALKAFVEIANSTDVGRIAQAFEE
jgi:2-methylcitrate dehydratase PrpD